MIKIYTVYNDGLINLLEKFFEMKKSECKDTIGVYRRFLMRQESVQRFLQLAEVAMAAKSCLLEIMTSYAVVLFQLGCWCRQGDSSESETGS